MKIETKYDIGQVVYHVDPLFYNNKDLYQIKNYEPSKWHVQGIYLSEKEPCYLWSLYEDKRGVPESQVFATRAEANKAIDNAVRYFMRILEEVVLKEEGLFSQNEYAWIAVKEGCFWSARRTQLSAPFEKQGNICYQCGDTGRSYKEDAIYPTKEACEYAIKGLKDR